MNVLLTSIYKGNVLLKRYFFPEILTTFFLEHNSASYFYSEQTLQMESPFYNLFLFQMIEQNNYGVQEFIFNKKAESNFEAVKNKVGIYIKVFI